MKSIAPLLLSLGCCAAALAQPAPDPGSSPPVTTAPSSNVATAETATASSAPFLWRVTVGDVSHYLLGSV
ncbi:MAG TPA: hypothetical protein VFM56_12345, partial [Solimonas sp.]|nr:hypothetical protein [Solimonas sp.]